jgi:protease-4
MKAKRNQLGCIAIILFLALCGSVFFNVIFVVGKSAGSSVSSLGGAEMPKFEEQLVQPGSGDSHAKIAQISMRGIISSSIPGDLGQTMVDDLKMQLRQAVEDSKVKAIVLVIDSPGGEVTASDVIYTAVTKAREKKPVVVYMDSLAASGGYYVSCGGSYTIANETTLTGSIGVIMQTLRYQGLFQKVGLEMLTVKSGKMKDMLSGSRETTPEELAYVQALIMQTYGKFVGIVARERKLDEQTLRNGIADGRVVSGKDALENKLVDALGNVEDAYAKAMELGKAKSAPVIRYEAAFHLGRLFKLLGQSDKGGSGKVEVSLVESLKPKLEVGRMYFLPSTFSAQ